MRRIGMPTAAAAALTAAGTAALAQPEGCHYGHHDMMGGWFGGLSRGDAVCDMCWMGAAQADAGIDQGSGGPALNAG